MIKIKLKQEDELMKNIIKSEKMIKGRDMRRSRSISSR